MELKIEVEKRRQTDPEVEYIADPQEALDLLEELRLQAGKFIYEYPARLRRTVEVVPMKPGKSSKD